jgi:hypothetical protein
MHVDVWVKQLPWIAPYDSYDDMMYFLHNFAAIKYQIKTDILYDKGHIK